MSNPNFQKSVICLFFIISLFGSAIVNAKDTEDQAYEQKITVHQKAGDLTQALTIAKQYLALVERKYGKVHKNTANALYILGNIYFSDGQYNMAEQNLRNGLKMEERVAGLNHPDLVRHLSSLATLNYTLLRFEEADRMTERAKKLSRR